jgi:hypothetical protein
VSQQQNPIERAVDLFVFAPVGVAMFAKDTVPTFMKMFVSRGQTELQHRKKALHDQVNQYRSVGKFAVRYGGPEVRRQAEGKLDGARRVAEETFTGLVVPRLPGGSSDETIDAPPPAKPAKVAKVEPPKVDAPAKPRAKPAKKSPTRAASTKANGSSANGKAKVPSIDPPADPFRDRPVESALAIPEYDQLSASQVVERLDGLTADELDAVRAYELAHRGRSTILGKIMQLTS